MAVSDYQKAFICPYKQSGPVLEEKFFVQFNPSEISIVEAVGLYDGERGTVPGRPARRSAGERRGWQQPLWGSLARREKEELVLSVTLFFNTLESLEQASYEDVRQYVKRLYRYTNRESRNSGTVEQICFFWGSIAVTGMLTGLSVRYTMFAPDGKPVRAFADITITGDYYGEQQQTLSAPGTLENGTGISRGGLPQMGTELTWRSRVKGKGNPRL